MALSRAHIQENKRESLRRASASLTVALQELSRAAFNLRMGGHSRAARGIEAAAKRVESWRGKVWKLLGVQHGS